MMKQANLWICFISCFFLHANCAEINPSIEVSGINRELDMTSQLVKETQSIEFQNTGQRPVKSFVFSIDTLLVNRLSYVGAKKHGQKQYLPVEKVLIDGRKDIAELYEINLGEGVKPGGSLKLDVNLVYVHLLDPYPKQITQSEQQFVVFEGSACPYSAYSVKESKTVIKLSPGQILSYSKDQGPVSQEHSTLTYGPQSDIKPFSRKEIRLHFENNAPFLTVTQLTRVIEVSHWGNIAVEETIDVEHQGAKLKGPFSRYDFQRDHRNSMPAVKSLKVLLPASSADVYYRDEIGNISTSNMRVNEDSVEIDMRPRFPLFGGWKTHYVLGYSLPSYEYLFKKGDKFTLQMRFVDFIFENFAIDHMTVKIILPESSKEIKAHTPYQVKQDKMETHHTYLDYSGRPVVVLQKDKLVPGHIQDFQLEYRFDVASMIVEACLLIAAFLTIFAVVIVCVRFDFTISKDSVAESRLKLVAHLEEATRIHEDRMSTYDVIVEGIDKARQNRDLSILQSAKKKTEGDFKKLTQQITDMMAQLKQDGPDVAEKMQEVMRIDRQVRDQLNTWVVGAERLIQGKMNKQQYNETEKNSKSKIDEWRSRMESIVYSL